jgi:RNA polymerase sigma factor (sigma-70 family)
MVVMAETTSENELLNIAKSVTAKILYHFGWGDRLDREDEVFSIALLKVVEARDKYVHKQGSDEIGWIAWKSFRLVIDELRSMRDVTRNRDLSKNSLSSKDAPKMFDTDGDMLDIIASGNGHSRFFDLIDELPGLGDYEEDILTRFYWQNKKQKDIARELGVSQAKISKDMKVLHQDLRAKFADRREMLFGEFSTRQ